MARPGKLDKGLKGLLLIVPGFESGLYDWIMGGTNGLKRLLRTVKVAHTLALPIVVEIPLLRVNIDMLESMFFFLSRLKVRDVLLRRITASGESEKNFIALSPRFSLISSALNRSLRRAQQLGIRVQVEGVPPCFFPSWSDKVAAVRWLDGSTLTKKCANGCILPMDYNTSFGADEFACLQLTNQSVYLFDIKASQETREIRRAFSEISAMNPEKMILQGELHHADMYSLLREALRLSVPTICLRGDVAPLFSCSLASRIRLRSIVLEVEVLGANAKEHEENGGDWAVLSTFLETFHTVSLFYGDRVFSFPSIEYPKNNLQ